MRTVMALLALSFFAGCTQAEVMPREQLNVSGPQYRLNVASINVTHDYIAPKRAPNVDHLADITPSDAVRKWAGERLQAAGRANSMEVDIKDASVIRKELPKQKTGIEGAFTTEQTEEYDGRLEVELKIYTPQSVLPTAHINAAATEQLTLPQNAAPIDRERAYHQMTVGLMNRIIRTLDDQIHDHFGNYVM